MSEKKAAPAPAGEEQEKKSPRRKTANRILTAVFTLLLIALAVLVFVFREELTGENLRKNLGRTDSFLSAEDEAFSYETGTDQVFAAAGDCLAVVSSSAIQLLDEDGETVFKQVVSYETPAVFPGTDCALFCDIGSTDCVIATREGESRTAAPAGNILTADMNENGWWLLVTESAGYKGLVSVYNSADELQYEWWSGSGYVLKASLSPDNKLLAVLCVGTDGGKLHFFSLTSETELASAVFPGELYFDMYFMGSDTVCAIGEQGMVFLSADGTETGRRDFGGSYLIDYEFGSRSFAAVLLNPYRTGSGGTVLTLDGSGTELGRTDLTRDVSSLSACGKQLLVMTGGDLSLFSQDLSLQSSVEQLMTAKRALLLPGGSALLLSAYSAERLRF